MPKSKNYVGQEITIRFEPGRCIHAAECVKGLPGVFDANRRPWIEPDAAKADEIAAVVRRCPTGALHYEAETVELEPEINQVRLARNGPLYVHAKTQLLDAVGETIVTDTRVALCRCGASQNKPFCDGRHRDAGFEDTGLMQDACSDSAETVPDGDLSIRTLVDGPLLCTGRYAIVDHEGQQIEVREGGALCRCGESANKPFCDGSHTRIGFKA